jgi:DHA2 family multidrug resistance protein
MNEPAKIPEHPSPPATTNPYVGILAVFLGAGLATLNSRLLSVGLQDLRGALGLSFDDASWLPTALNMATMFSGVFVVFLNAFWGLRSCSSPDSWETFSATGPLRPATLFPGWRSLC